MSDAAGSNHYTITVYFRYVDIGELLKLMNKI